jgi:chromosome partition protein MukF
VPETRADLHEVVTSLATRGVALELSTLDLCFLAALHLRATHGSFASAGSLGSFTEEQLVAVFDDVQEVAEPQAQGRRRASDAIRRLREQRMLARVDGSGVVRAGEFALTRLATGIVEFFLEQETLTRESLTLLLRTLLASLTDLAQAASAASSPSRWKETVVAPLAITVADLVAGIQRRQRGFDLQQEQFQKEISTLLQADWFGAMDRCQDLLDSTGATLRELNQVLLRDAHALSAALQEIQELAAAAEHQEAEEAARVLMDQIDRIGAWGSARQRAWSEYYQYVHRFLRDVVRLDPSRVLTHRLHERLAGKAGAPFALVVADAPPLRVLRTEVPAPIERPPVRRRRGPATAPLADEPARDPQAKLTADVRAAVLAGARGLCEVTAEITGQLPPEDRFVAAGRVAHAIAAVCRPNAAADRPWLPASDDLLIEEWTVTEPR